ncbi:Carbonic anhydrase [Mycena chlorophos]|uniref:Carbonic anhydrase n=1 Tax=Mycena chlorophos TaxID=658473 RepID=A0A8H6T5F1_MYCCL|nr:Carbonic anhydrase [Mycena chlorophos]
MSSVVQEILAANEQYALKFTAPIAPRIDLLVVTCMDPRIQPYEQFGLKFGECGIVRNGGGSTENALPSILIAQKFGGHHIAVVHHTDCGMLRVTKKLIRDTVEETNGPVAAKTVDELDFHEFTEGLEASVKRDVQFLANHPAIRKNTQITGWIYDVQTGKISQSEDIVV